MNNRISVVMPSYNVATFITRTLDTIYNQTVLPYEVVIVDDGSTDNSVEIINDYVESHRDRFDNLVLFQQENAGAGAARNKAIELATGEWIAFLDSDDIWDSTKIEAVIRVMEEHPDITMIAHDEYRANEENFEDKELCSLHELYHEDKDLFTQVYKGNMFSTSCMVIRKDVIVQAGGFDATLRSAQDYDLWIRCCLNAKLYYLDQPLETYVVREGCITANTYRRYNCEMRICRKYIDELRKRYDEKTVRKMVRRRVYLIHRAETHIAVKQKDFAVAFKILSRLIPEYCKEI